MDHIPLLAALQPADIKEAIEAVQGSPIARAELRMIFAVSSILDQSSDREIEQGTREELTTLHGRFRALESEEVTDDQLSVLAALTKVGIPFADFGVWKPFGQRAAKS